MSETFVATLLLGLALLGAAVVLFSLLCALVVALRAIGVPRRREVP